MRDLRDDGKKIWNIGKNIPMKGSAWTITPVISPLVKCPVLSSDIITHFTGHCSSIRKIFPSSFGLSCQCWLYWRYKTGEPFILVILEEIYTLYEHQFRIQDTNTAITCASYNPGCGPSYYCDLGLVASCHILQCPLISPQCWVWQVQLL